MPGKKWSTDIPLATTEEIEAALPTAEIIFKKSDGQPRRALLAQAMMLFNQGRYAPLEDGYIPGPLINRSALRFDFSGQDLKPAHQANAMTNLGL